VRDFHGTQACRGHSGMDQSIFQLCMSISFRVELPPPPPADSHLGGRYTPLQRASQSHPEFRRHFLRVDIITVFPGHQNPFRLFCLHLSRCVDPFTPACIGRLPSHRDEVASNASNTAIFTSPLHGKCSKYSCIICGRGCLSANIQRVFTLWLQLGSW
jgi:hypothetical protein